MFQDSKRFYDYVKNCPSSIASPKLLSEYLLKGISTDIEKAYRIFLWMHFNIEYNMKGLLSGNTGKNDPDSVFKNKLAVCQGFSDLYKTIIYFMNIECVTIGGYAKGLGY
jgi:transglutaminase/protease-like cytokinesis protein 3